MRHLAPHHFLPDGTIKRWSLEPYQIHMVLCSWWHIRPSLSGLRLCAIYFVKLSSLIFFSVRAFQLQSWNFSAWRVFQVLFLRKHLMQLFSKLSRYSWVESDVLRAGVFWNCVGQWILRASVLIDQRREITEHHSKVTQGLLAFFLGLTGPPGNSKASKPENGKCSTTPFPFKFWSIYLFVNLFVIIVKADIIDICLCFYLRYYFDFAFLLHFTLF